MDWQLLLISPLLLLCTIFLAAVADKSVWQWELSGEWHPRSPQSPLGWPAVSRPHGIPGLQCGQQAFRIQIRGAGRISLISCINRYLITCLNIISFQVFVFIVFMIFRVGNNGNIFPWGSSLHYASSPSSPSPSPSDSATDLASPASLAKIVGQETVRYLGLGDRQTCERCLKSIMHGKGGSRPLVETAL